MVVIRLAKEEEALQVRYQCIVSNRTRRSRAETGFLEYPLPTPQEYRQRIHANPFFLIAEYISQPIGFSAAYYKEELTRLFPKDPIINHIQEYSYDFVYWDQLTVRPRFRKKNVASLLTTELLNRVKKKE